MYGQLNSEEEMKAHDVRQLRVCEHCNHLGDKRQMVGGMHGRCFIEAHGLPALVALPPEETAGLRLDDIGDEAMRALLDRPAVSRLVDTLCWNCNTVYAMAAEQCPGCGATNANKDPDAAQREMEMKTHNLEFRGATPIGGASPATKSYAARDEG